MHHQRPLASDRDRTSTSEKRGLTDVTFVGSFPGPDFRLDLAQPEVAFIGRSNVGKSSLLNALVGRRRLARTSKTPGKTQMCNVFAVDDGYYLVDLPGYGYAQVSKDSRKRFLRLIHDYLTQRERLAGIIWLLDIRHTPSAEDQQMADLLATTDVPVLAVATKADKIPRGRRQHHVDGIRQSIGIAEDQLAVTSARSGEGIEELQAAITEFLQSFGNTRRRPNP